MNDGETNPELPRKELYELADQQKKEGYGDVNAPLARVYKMRTRRQHSKNILRKNKKEKFETSDSDDLDEEAEQKRRKKRDSTEQSANSDADSESEEIISAEDKNAPKKKKVGRPRKFPIRHKGPALLSLPEHVKDDDILSQGPINDKLAYIRKEKGL